MMPPLDLLACGHGQPECDIDNEQWTSLITSDNLRQYYGIFDSMSTLAPSIATDPGSRDSVLCTNSTDGRNENYFGGEDSIYAEIGLQFLLDSPGYFPQLNRLDSAENFTSDVGELAELPPIRDFQFLDHQINDPRTETMQVLQGDLALPSGGSLHMPLVQEEVLAEDRNNSIEDIITSWSAAELYPAIEYPHNFVVGAASPCPVYRSKTGSKRKRGDAKSKKFTAEIRISKKIPGSGKLQKAWLGSYATLAKQQRALDVGKYFLCTKLRKTISDSRSEALLSTFQDRVHALPLPERVETVKKMAKHYGEHGTLPESLQEL